MKSKVNRLADVANRLCPDEDRSRSDEEALEIFREAMFKSKGKCNGTVGWYLAKHRDATIDDIIKFGVTEQGGGEYVHCRRIFNTDNGGKLSSWYRERKKMDAKFTKVKDTFIKKYLESKGLWDEHVERSYGDLTTDYRTVNNGSARAFCKLMNWAKRADMDKRFVKVLPKLARHWVESTNLEVDPQLSHTEMRKSMFDKEIEWLSHAPQEVLDQMGSRDIERVQCFTQAFFNSGMCNQWNDTRDNIEMAELARSFLDTIEHIGIGVADLHEGQHTASFTKIRIGLKSIVKKTLTMGNTFVRLVKKGYAPELARAEVIDQLNQYVKCSKSQIDWQFFTLDNAPKTYDYQGKAKQKVSKKANSDIDTDGCIDVPGIGKVKVR